MCKSDTNSKQQWCGGAGLTLWRGGVHPVEGRGLPCVEGWGSPVWRMGLICVEG